MTLFWGTLTLTLGMKRLVLKQTWNGWRKLAWRIYETNLDDEPDASESQEEPCDENEYRNDDESASSTGEEDTADDLVETMVERIGYKAIWKLHLWFTDRMQYSAEMATGRVRRSWNTWRKIVVQCRVREYGHVAGESLEREPKNKALGLTYKTVKDVRDVVVYSADPDTTHNEGLTQDQA
jgi:predicted RNA-binding protein with PIN domain